jgi:hypothetical protein
MNFQNVLIGGGLVLVGFYLGKKAKDKGFSVPVVDKLVGGGSEESNINGAQLNYYEKHSNAIGDSKLVRGAVYRCEGVAGDVGGNQVGSIRARGIKCYAKEQAINPTRVSMKRAFSGGDYNYASGDAWDSVPLR